jgi:hypothetical protein
MKTPTVKIDERGNKRWYTNGELHREDGPAIEWANGDRSWWINGDLHREDGPVIEYANGDKFWFINGKFHREDGPAIERTSGYKEWYIHGEKLTRAEFYKRTTKNLTPVVKVVEIDGIEYELKKID